WCVRVARGDRSARRNGLRRASRRCAWRCLRCVSALSQDQGMHVARDFVHDILELIPTMEWPTGETPRPPEQTARVRLSLDANTGARSLRGFRGGLMPRFWCGVVGTCGALLVSGTAQAQEGGLREKISELFVFSPGQQPLFLGGTGVHANHFITSASTQNGILISFLGNAIASNVASIPVDRKSTRLNSSHDQISYAVFCLKKKRA